MSPAPYQRSCRSPRKCFSPAPSLRLLPALSVEPIAKAVGISKDDIYANSLRVHADGSFAGHNPDEPTCCSGGKARVVVELKSRYSFSSVVMIGDGATDMEARELEGGADAFIGFGGVQIREKVKAGADLFITDFKEIMDSV